MEDKAFDEKDLKRLAAIHLSNSNALQIQPVTHSIFQCATYYQQNECPEGS
jgi:hypothetical protein